MDLMSDIHIDSLSVAAELIGPNHDSAAFIYGFMSLLDKLTCGIVVIGIQGVRHNVFVLENIRLVQAKKIIKHYIQPSFTESSIGCFSCRGL